MSPQVETVDVLIGNPFQKNCTPPLSVPAAKAYWILMSGPTAERRLFQTINFTNVAINDKVTKLKLKYIVVFFIVYARLWEKMFVLYVLRAKYFFNTFGTRI